MIDLTPNLGQESTLTDPRGIGIGAAEADIRRAYGQIDIKRAPYYDEEFEIEGAKVRAELGSKTPEPSPHYWIQVDSPDHMRAIIFDTQDGKVTSLRTGFKPAVSDPEVCQ